MKTQQYNKYIDYNNKPITYCYIKFDYYVELLLNDTIITKI